MKLKKIKINTKNKKYSIYVGHKIIKNIKSIIKKEKINFNKCLIIVDRNINQKYINIIKNSFKTKKVQILHFTSSEKNKDLKTVNSIINILLKNNYNRDDCIISVGGGILGDLSGFVANITKRGMKFINIPTTLLAQVDASIGGKTGINHKVFGKNLIGTFNQPDLVISDTEILNSLSKREIICGYAEILKHSLISDKNFFNYLDKNFRNVLALKKPFINYVILKSCEIKRNIVQKDEKENNSRKKLNLGHTFGHAYEASAGYKKNLNHGEGVILGILSATYFSYRKKLVNYRVFQKIIKHIDKLKFNLKLSKMFTNKDINNFIKFMQNDKKNNNEKINLILLKNVGKPIVNMRFSFVEIKKFFQKELVNL